MHQTRPALRRLGAWGLLWAGLATGVARAQTDPQPPPGGGAPPATTVSAGQGNAVEITINSSKTIKMSTGRRIKSVVNEKETVARVQPDPATPSAVLIVGLAAGSTQIKLTDEDGKTETLDVLVQIDLDALKSVIRRMFPTAKIDPIAAGNTIVLTGYVNHPEDIEPILRVAQGVLGNVAGTAGGGGPQVYNSMRVGGVRQVQLDVVIASVNRSEARRKNASFIVNGTTVSAGSILPGLFQQPQQQATGNSTGGTGSVGIRPLSLAPASLPTNGQTGANLIFGIVPANFNLLLQALRTEGLAKFLAEPKLVTMSGHPAYFLAGGEEPVIGPSSGITGPGVIYHNTGTELSFLPIVLENGKISLQVQPKVTFVDKANGLSFQGAVTPAFVTQTVQTSVEMEVGQTFAIGGLIQTTTSATAEKVPVLGDLPYVGFLFSRVEHEERETELVILVTPYLIDAMDCKQAPCRLPGMETRKPDDYELYLESILEAPRGQRDVFSDKRYMPAYRNDATADQFPCGGDRGCGAGASGTGPCGPGACGTGKCGGPTAVGVAEPGPRPVLVLPPPAAPPAAAATPPAPARE